MQIHDCGFNQLLSKSIFYFPLVLPSHGTTVKKIQWDHRLTTHSLLWLTINVEHHLPHGGAYRLVETEPDFPPPAQWMIVSFRWGEKWPANWSVPNQRRWENENNECAQWSYLLHDLSMTTYPVMSDDGWRILHPWNIIKAVTLRGNIFILL